jgi:hypothetical protein
MATAFPGLISSVVVKNYILTSVSVYMVIENFSNNGIRKSLLCFVTGVEIIHGVVSFVVS